MSQGRKNKISQSFRCVRSHTSIGSNILINFILKVISVLPIYSIKIKKYLFVTVDLERKK